MTTVMIVSHVDFVDLTKGERSVTLGGCAVHNRCPQRPARVSGQVVHYNPVARIQDRLDSCIQAQDLTDSGMQPSRKTLQTVQ